VIPLGCQSLDRAVSSALSIGRNERSVNEHYESASHFVERIDSGDLDQTLGTEIKKLTREQLEEVAQVLMNREANKKTADQT